MCIIFKYHQTNCHSDLIEVEQVPTSSAFGKQLSLLCYFSYQHINNKAIKDLVFRKKCKIIWEFFISNMGSDILLSDWRIKFCWNVVSSLKLLTNSAKSDSVFHTLTLTVSIDFHTQITATYLPFLLHPNFEAIHAFFFFYIFFS